MVDSDIHGAVLTLYTTSVIGVGWLLNYVQDFTPAHVSFALGFISVPVSLGLWVFVFSPLSDSGSEEGAWVYTPHPLPNLISAVLERGEDQAHAAGWDVEKRDGELEIGRHTDKGNHIEVVSTVPLSWEPPEEFGGGRE